jgi:hypothetical protein
LRWAPPQLVYLNVDDDELWRRIHGRGLEDPHTAAVDPNRLGAKVGQRTFDELRQVDAALRLVLDL